MRRTWLLPTLALAACHSGESADAGPDPNANADGDCMTDAEERTLGTNPAKADSDLDTLSDCDEIDLGTDPILADTDADGLTDSQEVTCVSNPLDPAEKCFACGWKHNDPGNIVATGKADGDVMHDLELVDQCQEPVHLYDFATTADSPMPEPASYYILFMTAVW